MIIFLCYVIIYVIVQIVLLPHTYIQIYTTKYNFSEDSAWRMNAWMVLRVYERHFPATNNLYTLSYYALLEYILFPLP